jgi:PTS hybrid protein
LPPHRTNNDEGTLLVGIVVVSHSADLARGVAELAGQVAGSEVQIAAAGGGPDGTLGTDDGLVREAIRGANRGDGVVILGDLGSAILTIRQCSSVRATGTPAWWMRRWSRAPWLRPSWPPPEDRSMMSHGRPRRRAMRASSEAKRVEAEVTLPDGIDLHARPAAELVRTAMRFSASVSVAAGEREVDAKSLLSILALGAERGTSLRLRAEGEDATAALDALCGCVAAFA